MEVGMAPPHKRRKLSELSSRESITLESEAARLVPTPTPTLSHGLEHLSHASAPTGLRQVPQRIEEVHLQIHQQAVPALDGYLPLHRRQGTGVSSEPTLAVTVVANVASDGSTTALSTTSDAASDISSYAATATSTVVISPTPSGSTSLVSSTSESASGSSSTDTVAPTSTENSTESSTTLSSTTSGSESTASGFIGNTPIASSITSSSANSTAESVSITGTVSSLSAAATLSGSASQNLTTSALIIQDASSTYTTRTTIDLNSSTSRSGSRTTESGSQTVLGAAFFLSTLADGVVETFSRASSSYITTFPDGRSATVPAATGSYVTSTGTNGATSIVYETTSASPTNAEQSTITSMSTVDGAGQPAAATSSASSSTTSASSGSSSNNNVAPPGTIAGGVVGGAAGLAVILLIAMLFLRWYRRRSQLGHQALPPNAGVSPEPDHDAGVTRQPGMAERAGLMPALGAVPALFRHQNRSREEPEPTERSFTRVSGRKLPSSFSPGMSTSPPPTMPLTGASDRNLSTTSFYRDSAGFYGGTDTSATPGSAVPGASTDREELTLSPGPQRRPTVHTGGPYVMSPTSSSPATPHFRTETPGSPPGTAATAATFDRSDTPSSLDPNRGSRFTEEV